VALSLVVLAGANVVSNRVVTGAGYVVWNVAVAAVLVVLARRVDRLTWDELGLARRDVRSGVRWGLAFAAIVAVVFVVAVVVPDLRDLFRDRRVGDRTGASVFYETLVRIPLGTVVLEEIAFRGVLLGQLRRRGGTVRGLLGASVAFGLWHVLPAWNINTVNPLVTGADLSRVTAVGSAVVGTALAGIVMGWLRLRGRHVLASALLHVATNSGGFAVAWLVLRR
jgi:membrane protease YdiL (CAAX protease family)